MAKQTFTVGQVLTADQMTSLQQTAMGGGSATAKTASYTLVAADAGTTVIMNSGSATTITVNTALFAAGDTVYIVNQGAGVCTITAGTATVDTASSLALSQYETGELYFLSASAAIFSEYTQAAASSGGMTLLSTTSLSGASTTVSSISGAYNDLIVYAKDWYASSAFNFLVTVNGDFTASNYQNWISGSSNGSTITTYGENNNVGITVDAIGSSASANNDNFAVLYFPNYANATTRKVFTCTSGYVNASGKTVANVTSYYSGTVAAISSMRFLTTVGTWSGGSVEIYGVK